MRGFTFAVALLSLASSSYQMLGKNTPMPLVAYKIRDTIEDDQFRAFNFSYQAEIDISWKAIHNSGTNSSSVFYSYEWGIDSTYKWNFNMTLLEWTWVWVNTTSLPVRFHWVAGIQRLFSQNNPPSSSRISSF